MSRALRVEVEALVELEEAAAWYEDKRPGLGTEFVEAIERTLLRVREMPASFVAIMKHPLSGERWFGNFHTPSCSSHTRTPSTCSRTHTSSVDRSTGRTAS